MSHNLSEGFVKDLRIAGILIYGVPKLSLRVLNHLSKISSRLTFEGECFETFSGKAVVWTDQKQFSSHFFAFYPETTETVC